MRGISRSRSKSTKSFSACGAGRESATASHGRGAAGRATGTAGRASSPSATVSTVSAGTPVRTVVRPSGQVTNTESAARDAPSPKGSV
jgi:hypothetical protein